MGLSSSISLIVLVLVIILSFGTYMNLVMTSVRINDPRRINLITRHIKEDLDCYKLNGTGVEKYIYVENMWYDDTYITDIVIVAQNGTIIKEINLQEYITIPTLSALNITRDMINQKAGDPTAITPNLYNDLFEDPPLYNVILITKYGNSFPVKRVINV